MSFTKQKSCSNLLPQVQQQEDAQDAFRVYVRVRPLNQKELTQGNNRKELSIIKVHNNIVNICDSDQQYDYTGKRDKSYCFDNVFDQKVNNTSIFNYTISPLISSILDGFNVTCFAYGMTGAGKTHTMLGTSSCDQNYSDMGLCLQSIQGLFLGMLERQMEYEYDLKVSYLEIYNEQVRDLLVEKSSNLMIVEDPTKGVIVPDLQEFRVNRTEELESLIIVGNQRRIMAPTGANQFSSRSHAILIFTIEGKNKKRNIKEEIFYSKLQLIDLAGSERAAASDNRGQRMVEGANINKSLLALGNCINILSDRGKAGSFVPYRDSKLTRLLKDSLGGNTKTLMIACISQSYQAYEETVNTLKYASRARNIKRVTTRNVKEVEMHVSKYKDIIENLRNEIEVLRGQLRNQQSQSFVSNSPFRNLQQQPQAEINSQRGETKNPSIPRPKSTRLGSQLVTQGNVTPIKMTMQPSNLTTYRQLNKEQQSPLDSLDESQSWINAVDTHQISEIEEQIFKTQTQKRILEQELILSDQKIAQSKSNDEIEEQLYIEKLSQNLLSNFEEHWELKQSINDLEELQNKNQEQLVQLKQDILELEKQQQLKSNNQTLGQQILKVIQFKQSELAIIEKNFSNNIQILAEMKQALDVNQEQKTKLQGMLLKMHSSKKKSLIETQIEMRKLKLEKTDLHLENLEMKKLTQQQLIEKDINEQKIHEMQRQIELMQKKLQEKDSIIIESQKQLQKKDQELQMVSSKSHHQKHQSFSANNTVKIDAQIQKQELRRESAQNQGMHSARAQWNIEPQKYHQEINKKLVLSGFFEDDFSGDVIEKKQEQEAPSALNIISSVLQQKRESTQGKQKKGCTPNNRYHRDQEKESSNKKNNNLNISNITVNIDTNQSEIMQFDDFFNGQDQQQHLRKVPTDKQNQYPVVTAQINLYQEEKRQGKIELHQPILQTTNQRYEENAKKGQKYENRRESGSKKNGKSSKLNRYLSFQRQSEDAQTNDRKNDESEKENYSRNTVTDKNNQQSHREQNEMFRTFTQNNEQKVQAFSPTAIVEKSIDIRQQNKFELRKYSQQSQSQVPRKPSPARASQESSMSSTTSVLQSYAQIRKASKERQLSQQQNNAKRKGTPSKNNEAQFKIDLSNTIKNKASAAATISRYGPIKPTHSATNTASQLKASSFGYQVTATSTTESQGQSYFENFMKKKNSMLNFNSQPNSLSCSQKTGAVKVLGSPMTQQSSMKLKPDLDSLLNKQKEQLNKDKEKLQKKQTIFTNSFGSTLINQIQKAQTERLSVQEIEKQFSERLNRYLDSRLDDDDKVLKDSPDTAFTVPSSLGMKSMK